VPSTPPCRPRLVRRTAEREAPPRTRLHGPNSAADAESRRHVFIGVHQLAIEDPRPASIAGTAALAPGAPGEGPGDRGSTRCSCGGFDAGPAARCAGMNPTSSRLATLCVDVQPQLEGRQAGGRTHLVSPRGGGHAILGVRLARRAWPMKPVRIVSGTAPARPPTSTPTRSSRRTGEAGRATDSAGCSRVRDDRDFVLNRTSTSGEHHRGRAQLRTGPPGAPCGRSSTTGSRRSSRRASATSSPTTAQAGLLGSSGPDVAAALSARSRPTRRSSHGRCPARRREARRPDHRHFR